MTIRGAPVDINHDTRIRSSRKRQRPKSSTARRGTSVAATMTSENTIGTTGNVEKDVRPPVMPSVNALIELDESILPSLANH